MPPIQYHNSFNLIWGMMMEVLGELTTCLLYSITKASTQSGEMMLGVLGEITTCHLYNITIALT